MTHSNLALFSFAMLCGLWLCACGGQKQNIDERKEASYQQYRDNALWKSLEKQQKEMLQLCLEKETEGGASINDFERFKQMDLDRLIRLRLINFNKEVKKYQLTNLGRDVLIHNLDSPKSD